MDYQLCTPYSNMLVFVVCPVLQIPVIYFQPIWSPSQSIYTMQVHIHNIYVIRLPSRHTTTFCQFLYFSHQDYDKIRQGYWKPRRWWLLTLTMAIISHPPPSANFCSGDFFTSWLFAHRNFSVGKWWVHHYHQHQVARCSELVMVMVRMMRRLVVDSHSCWKNSRLKFWACSKCNCEINDMNSFGNDILVKKGDRNGWDVCVKAKDS